MPIPGGPSAATAPFPREVEHRADRVELRLQIEQRRIVDGHGRDTIRVLPLDELDATVLTLYARPVNARFATALRAFEETLESLDLDEGQLSSEASQAQLGRRAALVAAAEAAWTNQLGPLYGWQEVAELLGSIRTRQGVNDLARRGRLLGLPMKRGQVLYPAFQFVGGRPVDGLSDVLAILGPAPLSPWSLASWFTTPQDELEGETPVARLARVGADDDILTAARRTASRVAV